MSTEHDRQGGDDQGPALDLRALQADPLLLLNTPEEDLRTFFASRLKKPAEVTTALTLVAAFRRVFEALDAEALDMRELMGATGALTVLWEKMFLRYQPVLYVEPVEDDGAPVGEPRVSLRVAHIVMSQDNEVWWSLWGLSWESAPTGVCVWDLLWAMFETGMHRGDYPICEQCGVIFPRRRGPTPRFCSSACRAKHWRQAH